MPLKEENRLSISVVVPIYNVEKYLSRCIESILNQTRLPDEIILVDDGSPDSSGKISDEYAAKYPFIKVIHKPNGGLSSARKAGWEQAKGDLITFVDSDDYLHKDYLKRLSEPFQDKNTDLSICGYYTDDQGEISQFKLPYDSNTLNKNDIASDYILPLIGTVPNAKINIPGFVWIRMYRTNLLQESDFVSEREYFTEDILMNILYAKRMNGNIAVVNIPLYFYCINPGSLTLKYRKNAFNMLLACNQQCDILTSGLSADPSHRRMRLDANLVATITYSIYNIGRIRNYKKFKSELLNIFNTPAVVNLYFREEWPMDAVWHKIIFYSYKFKLYFILYKLLKTRKVL